MVLFWFLVVLSVYLEILCYKIYLETEKMWSICRKNSIFRMLLNIENRFLDYFPLQNQTPKLYFPYRNSLSPTFILHSKFDLHWTKNSLNNFNWKRLYDTFVRFSFVFCLFDIRRKRILQKSHIFTVYTWIHLTIIIIIIIIIIINNVQLRASSNDGRLLSITVIIKNSKGEAWF